MASEVVFQKGGHALRMDGNGGAEALDLAELGSVVPVDGRYWIHLDLNNDEDLDWLENRSGLDELALEALRAESTRPRMMLREEGLLLALRGVNLNPSADPEDMVSIRIVADAHRLIRHIENLDATRDRAALAQEEMASRTAEQLNGRMYVLSVVAAIFLPLGFLTGLLGVNLAGIPGAENRHAFLWFLAALVLIVALLLGFFFSRKWIQPRNQS